MPTGKTTNPAPASTPFNAADYLIPDDLPGYLAEVIDGGDTRALPLALRTAADVIGMAKLAERTGLSRETLYRTLSERGNPRLDTLAAILDAFGVRLAIRPAAAKAVKRIRRKPRGPRVAAAKRAAELRSGAV